MTCDLIAIALGGLSLVAPGRSEIGHSRAGNAVSTFIPTSLTA